MAREVKDHKGNVYRNTETMANAYGLTLEQFNRRRFVQKWSVERVLTTPHVGRKVVKDHLGNVYQNIETMAAKYGITKHTFKDRKYKRKWDLEKCLTYVPFGKDSAVMDHLGNKYESQEEMLKFYGISQTTFNSRKALGWELKESLITPTEYREPNVQIASRMVGFTKVSDDYVKGVKTTVGGTPANEEDYCTVSCDMCGIQIAITKVLAKYDTGRIKCPYCRLVAKGTVKLGTGYMYTIRQTAREHGVACSTVFNYLKECDGNVTEALQRVQEVQLLNKKQLNPLLKVHSVKLKGDMVALSFLFRDSNGIRYYIVEIIGTGKYTIMSAEMITAYTETTTLPIVFDEFIWGNKV